MYQLCKFDVNDHIYPLIEHDINCGLSKFICDRVIMKKIKKLWNYLRFSQFPKGLKVRLNPILNKNLNDFEKCMHNGLHLVVNQDDPTRRER